MTATQQAVEAFVHYLATVRQLSPHTVDAYRRDLQALVQRAGDKPPTAIGSADLRALVAARRRAKPASIVRQLAAWRGFFAFLIKGGAPISNPVHAIAAPKRPASLPKALSPDDMQALLATPAPAATAHPTHRPHWLSSRDCAMMELLYSSALRLTELVQLDVSDIDLAAGVVSVQRGKGGRGRLAPLGAVAQQALARWLPQRKALLDGVVQPALFVGRGRTRLTGRSVQKRIDAHVQNSGFHKPVSPHVFRHSCASHFLQSSGDLRATQELLGHKDIAATQIYTRLDFQHLAKIYDAAHPRSKKD